MIPKTEVLGTVHPDGSLQLDQKLTVPPGRVRVQLEPVELPTPPAERLSDFIDRARAEMAAAGSPFMNEDEVTAWIEELRADDDRIEEVYRQAEERHRQQG
jgi:hypothetical protein